jgi:hypothetical protein
MARKLSRSWLRTYLPSEGAGFCALAPRFLWERFTLPRPRWLLIGRRWIAPAGKRILRHLSRLDHTSAGSHLDTDPQQRAAEKQREQSEQREGAAEQPLSLSFKAHCGASGPLDRSCPTKACRKAGVSRRAGLLPLLSLRAPKSGCVAPRWESPGHPIGQELKTLFSGIVCSAQLTIDLEVRSAGAIDARL